MVNYKQVRSHVICGNVQTQIPNGAQLKYLFDITNLATAADSMFDTADNLVYTPDRKFRMLGLIIYSETTLGGTLTIHQGDTEDAQTTLLYTITIPKNTFRHELPLRTIISVGKYLVIKPQVASVRFINIIGYEIDEYAIQ